MQRCGSRHPALLGLLHNLDTWRGPASFKPKCGDAVHEVAHLQFEEAKRTPEDPKQAVMSSCKMGNMTIPANQDMFGQ
jgi:hypothetical protein